MILNNISLVTIFNYITKLLGYIRDFFIAFFFGTTSKAELFIILLELKYLFLFFFHNTSFEKNLINKYIIFKNKSIKENIDTLNNELDIFKYSGLKNTKILQILSLVSFFVSILTITIFYSFSSNLQHYYLQIKNQFSNDKLYLAVINKNGLWVKDIVNDQINIINSSKIDGNYLI